jgi:hypothetical protein
LGILSNDLLAEARLMKARLRSVLDEAKETAFMLENPPTIPAALADWSGPNAHQIKKALHLFQRIQAPELTGLLANETIRGFRDVVFELNEQVKLINKDGRLALEAMDVETLRAVMKKAVKIGLSATGQTTIEADIKASLLSYQDNPSEYLRTQRRIAKDKIVELLNKREELIGRIDEFEREAQHPNTLYGNSAMLLRNEQFRKEHYPLLHEMQDELTQMLDEYESRYDRRLNWNGTDAKAALLEDIQRRFGEHQSHTGMRLSPKKTTPTSERKNFTQTEPAEQQQAVALDRSTLSPRVRAAQLRAILRGETNPEDSQIQPGQSPPGPRKLDYEDAEPKSPMPKRSKSTKRPASSKKKKSSPTKGRTRTASPTRPPGPDMERLFALAQPRLPRSPSPLTPTGKRASEKRKTVNRSKRKTKTKERNFRPPALDVNLPTFAFPEHELQPDSDVMSDDQ